VYKGSHPAGQNENPGSELFLFVFSTHESKKAHLVATISG